jgi:hypothetical protein
VGRYAPGVAPDTGEGLARGISQAGGAIGGAIEKHEIDLQKDSYNDMIMSQAIQSGEVRPEVLGYKPEDTPSPAELWAKYKGMTRQAQTGAAAGAAAMYVQKLQEERAQTAARYASANAQNALANLYRQGGEGGPPQPGPAQDVQGLEGWKQVWKPSGKGGGSWQLIPPTGAGLPAGVRVTDQNVVMIKGGPKGAEHVATQPELTALMMSGAQVPGLKIGGGQQQQETPGEQFSNWFNRQFGGGGSDAGVQVPVKPPGEAQAGGAPGAATEPPDGTPDVINGIPVVWRTGRGWVRAQ